MKWKREKTKEQDEEKRIKGAEMRRKVRGRGSAH